MQLRNSFPVSRLELAASAQKSCNVRGSSLSDSSLCLNSSTYSLAPASMSQTKEPACVLACLARRSATKLRLCSRSSNTAYTATLIANGLRSLKMSSRRPKRNIRCRLSQAPGSALRCDRGQLGLAKHRGACHGASDSCVLVSRRCEILTATGVLRT
jgi:hypothetical protein